MRLPPPTFPPLTYPPGSPLGAASVGAVRMGGTLTIVVDRVVRGSLTAALVTVSSAAPVTLGAKAVKAQDGDQFSGTLDEVFKRLR